MNSKMLDGSSPDQELIENTYPSDWVNPEPAGRYNLVVIGAGTAGLVTAAGAAGLGARVALVERHLFGGDCLNYGCVPSKALIRAARAAADVRDAGRFGVEVPEGVQVNFEAAMKRMRRVRADISHHDAVQRFADMGIDIFLGDAVFTDHGTVAVGDLELKYKRAVIATGARAGHPDVEGLEEGGFLTNETVFNLTELPARLAVIGAGPIGCELAQAFQRLGSQVILISRYAHIMPREDPEAALIVEKQMLADGLAIKPEARLTRVEKVGDHQAIHFDCGGEACSEDVDAILIGVGRVPNVEGLGLEKAGVVYDAGTGVRVNDRLQTTNKKIFAAGDVCMRYKFTHAADFAARIVIQNTLFKGRKKLSRLTIPWTTYTDPEVAHVGLTGKEAEKQGIAVDTYMEAFDDLDRAMADGETDGFVKVHTRKGKGEILGATIVARHAGEMIGEITEAMVNRVSLGGLASIIHPYPTQAEAIRKTGDAYNRTRLTPFVKKLFSKWLAWTR